MEVQLNDTDPAVALRLRKLMMERTGEERVLMGCSMFDAAKKIAGAAIRDRDPQVTRQEMRGELFRRFYGLEFGESERERILGGGST